MDYAERQKPPAGSLVLDHVSHFVARIDDAARTLQSLGFALTPPSVQMLRDARGESVPAGALIAA